MASSSYSSSSFSQYPHPLSMINVGNFVSVKLTRANYPLWEAQMRCLISSQDLLRFIDDPNEAPPDPWIDIPVLDDAGYLITMTEKENPEYVAWRRADKLLKGWIIGSLSEDYFLGIAGTLVSESNTARDVWTKLAISSYSSFSQYPYPSKINVGNFVSVKLTYANYRLWEAQMRCLIISQDMFGFIDGSTKAPPRWIHVPVLDDAGSETTTKKDNPEYLAWTRTDKLLNGWIIGSLTEAFLGFVRTLKKSNTARDVWTKLAKLFEHHYLGDETSSEEDDETETARIL
uniref:Retrotransposon Copia-like N-terminal domain-containing protein n=1 Tax=Davidia involucrata TaxID=16924 RepID=A0A5B6ZP47_DAVIN